MTKGQGTFKHAAIYSVAGIMGRMMGFIMLPFYSHILRGHGYAVIGMLDFGLSFLISLLTYGVRGSIIRLYHDEKDPAKKRLVVSTGIRIIAVVAAAVVLPLMLFAKPIAGLLLDDPTIYRYVIMALIGFYFDLVGQGASAWLLIRSRSVQFASINLVRLFLGLSLNIWLIVLQGRGLDGYFISSLVTNIFSGSIMVFLAVRECGTGYDPAISRTIRGFLLPLIPSSMASFVSRQIERVLVKFQIDLVSVGILEMGYKFPVLIAQLISRPLMQSWNTRRFEIADEPGAPMRISRMFTYFLFMVSFAGLLMAVAIKPLLVVLTPPEFHGAYRITRVEIISTIMKASYYHLAFGLFFAKDTKSISKIRGISSALKVPLTWFFIDTWGIFGAAYSALVTSTVVNVVMYRASQKKYHLDFEWKKIAVIFGGGLLMFTLISRWDLTNNPFYLHCTQSILPWLVDQLQGTFLGTWKSGKAVALFTDRTEPMAEILVRSLAATSFIVVLPFVHDKTGTRVKNLVHRAWHFTRRG